VEPLVVLSLLAALAVCVILGANNASACVSTSLGIISLSYSALATVGGIGVILGTAIEGSKLSNTIYGGVLNRPSDEATIVLLLATLTVMLVATTLNLPLSLTQAMVGAAIPLGLVLKTGVNWNFTGLVAVSWILTPLVASVLSVATYHLTRLANRRIGNLFERARLYAAVTFCGSFYTGYTLGANGVGLIYGISRSTLSAPPLFSLLLSSATVAGIFLFGCGVAATVSDRILSLVGAAALAAQLGAALTVHLFTQLGIPVSITQATIGGIAGIGQAKDIAIMNRQIVLRIILGWIAAPVTGLAFAWLLLALI
jgi:PiT family inorganic phosphate transporter